MDSDIQLLQGIVVASTALMGIAGLILTELRLKDPKQLTNLPRRLRKFLNRLLIISVFTGFVTTFISLGYFFGPSLISTAKWLIWVIFAIQGSTFIASVVILAASYEKD
jgi:uncharacterized membrane protein